MKINDTLTTSAPVTPEPPTPSLSDAAEMLWLVLANVSGGDWTQQAPEWQEAAARWRDCYFTALTGATASETEGEYLREVLLTVRNVMAATAKRVGYLPDQRGYSATVTDDEQKWSQAIQDIDRILAAPLLSVPADPEPPRCVCVVDDGLVREWVQKAREVAKSKGYGPFAPLPAHEARPTTEFNAVLSEWAVAHEGLATATRAASSPPLNEGSKAQAVENTRDAPPPEVEQQAKDVSSLRDTIDAALIELGNDETVTGRIVNVIKVQTAVNSLIAAVTRSALAAQAQELADSETRVEAAEARLAAQAQEIERLTNQRDAEEIRAEAAERAFEGLSASPDATSAALDDYQVRLMDCRQECDHLTDQLARERDTGTP